MAKRILLALAAAAVVGAAFVVLVGRQGREASAKRAGAHLVAFDDRAVTAVIVRAGGVDWRLERRDGSWRLVAPVEDTASAAAVAALLLAARQAPVVQTIDSGDPLAAYGLDPPRATLLLEGPSVPAIDVGTSTPAGDGVFVRVAGRPGVLVAALPQAAPFDGLGPIGLRGTDWLDFEPTGVRGIVLERPGSTVRLTRRPDGWWIEAPHPLPASAQAVEKLLAALASAHVVGVDDTGSPSDPVYGLGASALRLTVASATASRVLSVGAEAAPGRRFATSDARHTILVLESKPLDAAPVRLDDLRDTRLTSVNRYDVVRVDYAAGSRRFTASKAGGDAWTDGAGRPLASGDVYALLVALLEAPTTGWMEGAPAGAPAATLTYGLAGGTTGHVAWYPGSKATWDAVPGVRFALASDPPPPPQK